MDEIVGSGKATRTRRRLWLAAESWRKNDPWPVVNFDEAVIVVTLSKDPNRIFMVPTVNEAGNLSRNTRTTLMAFSNPTTCAYQLALVMRSTVKAVDGVEIQKPVK